MRKRPLDIANVGAGSQAFALATIVILGSAESSGIGITIADTSALHFETLFGGLRQW